LVLKKPKVAHSEARSICAGSPILELAMRARWVTILVTLGLFQAALSACGLCAAVLHGVHGPAAGRSAAPPERSTARQEHSARVDKLLQGDQDVDHWSTYAGRAVRFYHP
jgi:hypothetical protein